jgi:hypothetical protein
MTQDMNELEREIDESRARLDRTINRLQDKLSASGVIDDVLGTMRANGYDSTFDTAMAVLRRNPVPVMLVAAGMGWLIYRMSNDTARRRRFERLEREHLAMARLGMEGTDYPDAEVPVSPVDRARIYDPDTSPLHPTQDTLESRRELNARA